MTRDDLLYRWQRTTFAWARFCWWISRHIGGRSVFGKRDLTGGADERQDG